MVYHLLGPYATDSMIFKIILDVQSFTQDASILATSYSKGLWIKEIWNGQVYDETHHKFLFIVRLQLSIHNSLRKHLGAIKKEKMRELEQHTDSLCRHQKNDLRGRHRSRMIIWTEKLNKDMPRARYKFPQYTLD